MLEFDFLCCFYHIQLKILRVRHGMRNERMIITNEEGLLCMLVQIVEVI